MPPSLVVLADFFDRDELGGVSLDLVDGWVGAAQPNRPLAEAISLQWFVVVAWELAHLFEAVVLDGRP